MTDEAAEPYADYAGYELAAELPVQPVQHVTLALQVTPGGVSLAWEAGAARGMVAGSAQEVCRALGALVLRLAGAGEGPQVVQDEEPTRRLVRGV